MSEHTEQVVVIEWCQRYEAQYPELAMIFAIPNGGQRHKAVAVKLKAEGVKSGVPDLFMCVPITRDNKDYAGLVIEMKYGKNKTTENQDWWLEHLFYTGGFYCAVCYTAEEAIKTIGEYLNIPPEFCHLNRYA